MINTITEISIGVILITLLLVFIPFKIGLPDVIYESLINGSLYNIIGGIGYFFPVKFILICICCVYLAHFTSFAWKLIKWLRDMIIS